MRREGRMPVAAQTQLYRLDRLFQTRSTTYIPVGESAQVENAISSLLQNE